MENLFLSFAIGLVVSCVMVAILIPLLKRKKARQEILSYVTEHKSKQGTVTMGGIAIMLSVVACALIFFKDNSTLAIMTIIVTFGYAIVGFLDDFIKIKFERNLGLKAYQKIIVQLAIALIVGFFAYNNSLVDNSVIIPFTMQTVNLDWWMIPITVFIFLACTNGVNLTDGLDGLASSTTLCYMLVMSVLLVIRLKVLENNGETLLYEEFFSVSTLTMGTGGVLLGFLLFNANPAKIFMGDVGSLALGALVTCVSIFTGYTLFIPLIGICYVISCLSVILQVGYFKLTKGKRIFLMAPYHHHLQKKGLSETRIDTIYSAITVFIGCMLIYFAIVNGNNIA